MILRYFWVEGLAMKTISKMQDNHHDLDRLMNRKVLSNDLQEVGQVIAIDEESFIISRGYDNEYRIPKWRIERLLGNDVLVVDFRLNDLLMVELASLSYRTDE
jgi:hypothetical protein